MIDNAQDQVLGCMVGGAVGDALGYAVEFRGSLHRLHHQRIQPLRDPRKWNAGTRNIATSIGDCFLKNEYLNRELQ